MRSTIYLGFMSITGVRVRGIGVFQIRSLRFTTHCVLASNKHVKRAKLVQTCQNPPVLYIVPVVVLLLRSISKGPPFIIGGSEESGTGIRRSEDWYKSPRIVLWLHSGAVSVQMFPSAPPFIQGNGQYHSLIHPRGISRCSCCHDAPRPRMVGKGSSIHS